MAERVKAYLQNDRAFWAARSKRYNKLEWANKGDYLHRFIEAGGFKEGDSVLDVGTGTGIIAHTLAPVVRSVIGIDISKEMLAIAGKKRLGNVRYRLADAHCLPFERGTFDKVAARMVFHHVTRGTEQAMKECHRVLKKRGEMIFSEGVPPSRHVRRFFTEIFKLKEDRLTFMEADLVRLMRAGGFRKIRTAVHVSPHCSIRNWLENSNLPGKIQEDIFKMHLDLDSRGKRQYNMTLRDGDCFIDMKFVILRGVKG